ncbi:MAG: nitroreductase family protein [Thermoplasmatales archaeon]|nr:MAG: nitroreductase family protein [Thermoplasmatales archaeon]
MELKETIQKRYSVRSFSDKKPSSDIISEIIKYAHLAPSAGNLQARDFIIVDNIEIKKELSRAALDQEFIVEAPINIVVCANLNRISPYGARGKELYCIQDSAAAVEHILLLAVDNGLGTCWVGAFNENEASKILNLPTHVRPVAIIPIGYPKGRATTNPRIDTKILTHYNKW